MSFAALPIAMQVKQLLLHMRSDPPVDGVNALESFPFWATLTRAHKQRLLFALDQRDRNAKRARAAAAPDGAPRDSGADMLHAVGMVMRAFGDRAEPRLAAEMCVRDVVRAWIRGVVAVTAWRASLRRRPRASSASALPQLPGAVAQRLAPASAAGTNLRAGPIALSLTKRVQIKWSDLAALFPAHSACYSQWASAHDDSNASSHVGAQNSVDAGTEQDNDAADEVTHAYAHGEAQGSEKRVDETAARVGSAARIEASTRGRVGAMLAQRRVFLDRYTASLDGETYELKWHPMLAAWWKCLRGKRGRARLAEFAGLWCENKSAAAAAGPMLHRVRVRIVAPVARGEPRAAAARPAPGPRLSVEAANGERECFHVPLTIRANPAHSYLTRSGPYHFL